MKRNKRFEWLKIIEVIVILIIIPTFIFYWLSFVSLLILKIIYYFIVSLFVMQSFYSILNSLSALFLDNFYLSETSSYDDIPKTTFIVSAYLPNELDVIEETLLNILTNIIRPRAGIEIILAYNTPHTMEVEKHLLNMAYKYPELILANAWGSKSKSENLNYVLGMASGKMIVLLDADHLPEADCLSKAWWWLDKGYDAVQGNCKVRNSGINLLTGLIEIEFEVIYGVAHHAKTMLFESALFGGSNGYWKSDVLKSVKFRPDRLTEDIDATIRSLLGGFDIVHDRNIVSSELAPHSFKALWHQRKRWAQGWFQVSVTYQKDVFKTEFFNFKQRMLWTMLFAWRIFFDIFCHFIYPVVFAYWLYNGFISFPMNPFIWFAMIITLCSGPFEALAAYRIASKPRSSYLRYLAYALLALPYTMFKNMIQVVAILDELLGKREWLVTQRKNTTAQKDTGNKQ